MTALHPASPSHRIGPAPGTPPRSPLIGGRTTDRPPHLRSRQVRRRRLRYGHVRPRWRVPTSLLRVVACCAGFVALLLGMVGATPALAAPVAAGWQPAAGITGAEYFVGQYRNVDGTVAYCTDFERSSPERASAYTEDTTGTFVRGDGTVLSAEDDSALAFVLGRWGATADDDQAAAVQLAIWSITAAGMSFGSPVMDTFLRTQGLPTEIGARARSMVAQARAESGPYSITASFDEASGSSGEALEATVVSADGEPLAGLQVSAAAEGAVFADGSGTTEWTSTTAPLELQVRRTGLGPARVALTTPTVPATQAALLVPPEQGVQRLVVAPAMTSVTASIDLPAVAAFTPQVVTSTSTERTTPGAQVLDVLEVTAAAPGSWLVDPATGEDVGLYVVSTLWGPLSAPPVESATVPAGTPSLGSVTTEVSGPGHYETSPLTVPSAGYYVWTETIDASTVRPVEAAPFVHPWSGRFGLVPETTLVPWTPTVSTKLTRSTAAPGDLVQDTVTARGFNAAVDDDSVRLTMYGPLDDPPVEMAEVPAGTRVHSELEVPAHDGTLTTGDFAALRDPGCYTVVATFGGSADHAAFRSAFGIPDETVCVEARPDASPQPSSESTAPPAAIVRAPDPGPAAIATTSGTPAAELAQTGLEAGVLAGSALIAVGAGMGLRILARRAASPAG